MVTGESKLTINWMTGSPAPDCECLMNGLRCTDACCLQDCSNMKPEVDEQHEQDSSDDEA